MAIVRAFVVHFSEGETSTDADTDVDLDLPSALDSDGNRIYNGIVVSKAGQWFKLIWLSIFLFVGKLDICMNDLNVLLLFVERKADKNRLYNFSKVKKSRKWLKVGLFASF